MKTPLCRQNRPKCPNHPKKIKKPKLPMQLDSLDRDDSRDSLCPLIGKPSHTTVPQVLRDTGIKNAGGTDGTVGTTETGEMTHVVGGGHRLDPSKFSTEPIDWPSPDEWISQNDS